MGAWEQGELRLPEPTEAESIRRGDTPVCADFRRVVTVGPRFVMGKVAGQGTYEHDEWAGRQYTIVRESRDGLDWYLVRGVQPDAVPSDWDVVIHKRRCTFVGNGG